MAKNSPDGNPLAAAFQKLREGRGREAADLYHDIVKPTETPLVAHINRGIRHDEHGRHELAIEEFLAAEDMDRENAENFGPPGNGIRGVGPVRGGGRRDRQGHSPRSHERSGASW